MNLHKINDDELEQSLSSHVTVEREATTAVLHHLREFERRRLFARRGFSSLFEYCTKKLGYSESQAQRRINSARLLAEIPALEEKMNSGELNLTTLSQAQTFFRQEAKTKNPLSLEAKCKILKQLENQSTRQSEHILVSLATSPPVPKERARVIAGGWTEIYFLASPDAADDLKRLKEIFAAKLPSATISQIVSEALKVARATLDPLKKAEIRERKREKRKEQAKCTRNKTLEQKQKTAHEQKQKMNQVEVTTSKNSRCRGISLAPQVNQLEQIQFTHFEASKFPNLGMRGGARCRSSANKKSTIQTRVLTPMPRSRYIPVAEKDRVHLRDNGKCTYLDPQTGQRCAATYGVQLDHIQLYSQGGGNTSDNLRLRCKTHNLLTAMDELGESKLKRYWRHGDALPGAGT